ncbi:hypothetical protein GmHk_16G046171 [Glycine max]|nr:hypothetical protein GmHk_16G046171 [Glycine max]
MVRLLPPRDSLPSSTISPSTISMLIRSLDVAPTPSSPSTEVRPYSSLIGACGSSLVPTSTPSSSLIDARGPSPVPTCTPYPSPVVANKPIDEEVPNLAMEDPPSPLNDCLMRKLAWRSEEENEIKKAFNLKASRRFFEMFKDA